MFPDYLYRWIYLIFCTIFVLVHNSKINTYRGRNAVSAFGFSTRNIAVIFFVFIVIYIGTRPLSVVFTDMYAYAGFYKLRVFDDPDVRGGEIVWSYYQKICYYVFGMSSTVWLFTVTLLSMTLRYYACKNIFKENVLTGFLFIITSFSFWALATNIIRSDLALSCALFGLSIIIKGKSWRKYLWAFILFYLALTIHKSSALLVLSFCASYFVLKDIKWAIGFWVLCVLLSLFFHSYFESFFIGIGFDDRLERALTTEDDLGVFSHSGFRWDFLLYSIVPIVLGWFVSKKSEDQTYTTLLNTYIVANGFWVLVIRALFSDRFAGISWSLYGLVIAYPLLKVGIWKNQPKMVSFGLTGQLLFLWLMQMYYL